MNAARLFALTVVLAGGCGNAETKPAAPQHEPVALDDAQRETLARFMGTWTHAGGEAEQKAALDAVDEATEPMNGFIRGIARSRLADSVRIATTLTFSEQDGVVTITRSGQPAPFVAPANGKEFDTKTSADEAAKAWLRIEGQTLMTRMETEDGGGDRTYRIEPDGTLVIEARTFSPRLPADVKYVVRYAKQ